MKNSKLDKGDVCNGTITESKLLKIMFCHETEELQNTKHFVNSNKAENIH